MNLNTLTPLYKPIPDSVSRALDGTCYVVSGLAPTANGVGLRVDVAYGDSVEGGTPHFAYAGGNVTLTAASSSASLLYRRDIVYRSSAGTLTAGAGTAALLTSTTPVPPALPSNATLIAICFVAPGQTTLAAVDVEDCRQTRRETQPGTNVLEFGALGDNSTDDAGAIQNALNALGLVYLPGPKTYKITSADLTVPDQTWIVTAPDASINFVGHSLQVGSKTAQYWRTGCRVRVQGSAAANHALVEGWNLLGDHSLGERQVVVTLAATTTSDFYHAHSGSQVGGYADVKHVISTANYTCLNGLLLGNGEDSGGAIVSAANDFINGNTFEGTMACTNNGIRLRGTSPVGGVNAPIARNKFDRMDVNSFGAPAGAGRGFTCLDAAGSRNVFDTVTFETGGGGAAKDIDVGTCTNGQIFFHPICRTLASQTLAPRDVWLFSENDEPNNFGIYTATTNTGVPVTKQSGVGTRSAGDLAATAGGALADATSVTTTLTLLTGTTGKVQVTVAGSWNGTVGGGAEFAILVDGAVVLSVLDTLSSTGGNQTVSLTWLATGLSAAAHICKLQWRAITSNASLNGGTTPNRVTSISAVEVD